MTREPVAAKFMEMAEQARRETRELRAEVELLKAALSDIASDTCSRSGAVAIAKAALEPKP